MPAEPAESVDLLDCDVALARRYDVALLDLDGVVYLGPQAVPGAPQALRRARELGLRLAFVTNNAARPPEAVAAHLSELGIVATADEVTTSAQAAARYLAERLPGGADVLVIGTTGLWQALRERGLVPVEFDGPDVTAVVQGFSPELTWPQLAEAAVAINRGIPWIATNLDPTVPSPRGRLPGTGSMVAALCHATGARPAAVAGKPDPAMHRESVERSGARNPIVVGDRLDTDIEGANAAPSASLLVLSGVTEPAELLAAPPRQRPSYLAADVSGLLRTHRRPVTTTAGFRCGTWTATGGGGRWRLHDDPTPGGVGSGSAGRSGAEEPTGDDGLDALRVLCAAAWHGTAEGPWEPAGERAEAALGALGLR